VVAYLTDELVRQGHDVTLFASGDSNTSATLVPVCPRSLRLDRACVDQLAHHIILLERVFAETAGMGFDLAHFHIDYLHFPLSRRATTPHVTTLHGRLDLPDLQPIYREYSDMPVVSISNAQRTPLAGAAWQGTVYHGLPADLYTFRESPGSYLAFLGRISPEKRVDRAIEVATRLGLPLRIAAKVDAVDRAYFEEQIAPLLSRPGVEYVGELGEGDKDAFLGGALALLFPVDWPEPFGLVMIEAMACGTPVIAWPHGSVPEVIEHGTSGYIVSSIDAAVHAVDAIGALDRRKVRAAFDARFTAPRMAADYVRLYKAQLRLAKRAMLRVA
jgi:glycosyltransferase involved in cell wall biosynthesis